MSLDGADAKVDCFLEINGLKNPFWVDQKCNPRRVRKCLMDSLRIAATNMYLNGTKLTDETKPLVQSGLRRGDTIRVEFDSLMTLLAQSGADSGSVAKVAEKWEKECVICFEPLERSKSSLYSKYLPCGHICVCEKCFANAPKCPLCHNGVTRY